MQNSIQASNKFDLNVIKPNAFDPFFFYSKYYFSETISMLIIININIVNNIFIYH